MLKNEYFTETENYNTKVACKVILNLFKFKL